jgi:hypothetical protein
VAVWISVVIVAVVCGYAFVLARDPLVGGLCSGVIYGLGRTRLSVV